MTASTELELTDQDVREAMEEVPGYLDITPGDFRALYQVALEHAERRLRRTVHAAELMTREVVTVSPDTPLVEVADRMARTHVRGLPVVDREGRPVGVISEADFLSRLGEEARKGLMAIVARVLQGRGCLELPIEGRVAADIMSAPAVTVREGATIVEVAEEIARAGVNRLPVVSDSGVLVGILTRSDLVRAHLV